MERDADKLVRGYVLDALLEKPGKTTGPREPKPWRAPSWLPPKMRGRGCLRRWVVGATIGLRRPG